MSEISEERKNEIRQSEEYKTAKKIFGRLYLNMQRAKEFRFPHFELFKQMCHDFREKWEEAKKASAILRRLKMADFSSPEYESMSKMLAYLGFIESLGVALADLALILFIANEKEVHTRGPYAKHVTKVKELEDIDLKHKLDLLASEGLEIFAGQGFINQDTRNHMAHLKFIIQNDGAIRKKDRGNSPIHIDRDISKFWEGVDTLTLVFEDIGYLKEFVKEKV